MTIDTNTMVSISEANQNFSFSQHLICFPILFHKLLRNTQYIIIRCYHIFIRFTKVYNKVSWYIVFQNYCWTAFIYQSCNLRKILVCFGNWNHCICIYSHLNGIELKYTQKELYETILNVASGSVDYNGLLQWVLNHQN